MSPDGTIPPGRPIDWDLKTILLVVFFLGIVGTFLGVALKQAWPFLLARELEGTVEDYIDLKNRGLFRSVRHRRVITCSFREVYVRDGVKYGSFRCRLPDEIYNNPEKLEKVRNGRLPD